MRLNWLPLLALAGCFYVTADDRKARFDLDGDGVARPADCDDGDKKIGEILWFADVDGDGYGDPSTRQKACEAPDGYVDNDDDCDDESEDVKPGAVELCNGVDDDCNGTADDGAEVPTWYLDSDGDGQGDATQPVSACDQPSGYVVNADDCDDSSASVKLGGTEVACNGVDDDCDDLVDLDDPDVDPADWRWYRDVDGDGYGDENAAAPDDPKTACTAPLGYVDLPGDCEDGDVLVNPGVAEECNGYDDDCDQVTDPPGSIGALPYYEDADGDGQGGANRIDLCEDPGAGWVPAGGPADCDDGNPCTYVGAIEYCTGEDNDCDSFVDDVGVGGCTPDPGDTGQVCP